MNVDFCTVAHPASAQTGRACQHDRAESRGFAHGIGARRAVANSSRMPFDALSPGAQASIRLARIEVNLPEGEC